MGLFGLGRGEPVSVEFSLGLVSLTPWPANPPLRRLAFRWQRGTKVGPLTHTRMPATLPIGGANTHARVRPAPLCRSASVSPEQCTPAWRTALPEACR
jgi:hypothetical protein